MLIFLSKTRNKAEAWRVIAYIPWEKNYYSKKEHATKFEPAIKTFCLQQLYEAVLKNLKTTQGDGSLDNIELKWVTNQKLSILKFLSCSLLVIIKEVILYVEEVYIMS